MKLHIFWQISTSIFVVTNQDNCNMLFVHNQTEYADKSSKLSDLNTTIHLQDY